MFLNDSAGDKEGNKLITQKSSLMRCRLKLQNLIGCFKEMKETDDDDEPACVLRQYKHLYLKKIMSLRFGKPGLTSVHKNKIIKLKNSVFEHKLPPLANKVTYLQNKFNQSYLNCHDKNTESEPREGVISQTIIRVIVKTCFYFWAPHFFRS